MQIAWSSSHREFLISDTYYFSFLSKEMSKRGIIFKEESDFKKLFDYPVIVFNYPEENFTMEEKERLYNAVVEEGKRIILTAHFKNKDRVGEICNFVSEEFGIRVNFDGVKDDTNFIQEDPYIIVTSKVYINNGIKRVVFPYSASLSVTEDVKVILKGMETSKTEIISSSPILVAERRFSSGGSLVVCGSCIFWDNYSILKEDNLDFSYYLLIGEK